MSSDDLWFLMTRWLDSMALVRREDIDENNIKRKRSGTGQTLASDYGYSGDAVGELFSSSISQRKLPRKKKYKTISRFNQVENIYVKSNEVKETDSNDTFIGDRLIQELSPTRTQNEVEESEDKKTKMTSSPWPRWDHAVKTKKKMMV